MILIVTTLRPYPGRVTDYEAEIAHLMPLVRTENPGVLFFHAAKSREEPGTYRIVEAYVDQAAIDRHIASTHLQHSLARLMPLIEKIEITVSDVVA